MSTLPTIKSSETHEALSKSKELADFLFKSFYFSQGNTTLQYCILMYGSAYYGDVLSELSSFDQQEVIRITTNKATKWLDKGPHTPLEDIEEAVTANVGSFGEELFIPLEDEEIATLERGEQALLTTRQLILSDHKWLVENDGRPNRTNFSGEYGESYLSHAVHYGLLMNRTKNPAMDFMFKDLNETLIERVQNPSVDYDSSLGYGFGSSAEVNHKFRSVLDQHFLHRPQDKERVERLFDQN